MESVTPHLIAIVGRPNVGKSALLNRLCQRHAAIVEDRPGVTRDRIYAETSWRDHPLMFVDTGGLVDEAVDPLAKSVNRQVEIAVGEADLVLFVTDAHDGLIPADADVARFLRAARKPLLLVVNKADRDTLVDSAFYTLGVGEPLPVSAMHGHGTGDLLDAVVDALPERTSGAEEPPKDSVRIAIVGRPNAGKSTLVNRLTGEERAVVSDLPGTTRDPVDSVLRYQGREIVLVDTAGLRRRARIEEALEGRSAARAIQSLRRADGGVLLIDAVAGLTEQDKRIAGYADHFGRPLVIAINKWDAMEKDTNTAIEIEKSIRAELPGLSYAPVVFISAASGQRVWRAVDTVLGTVDESRRRVPTADVNRVIADAVFSNPVPSDGGRRIKIFYATQATSAPPTFVLFVTDPEAIHFSYARYLESRLRLAFNLETTPVRLRFRKRGGD